MFHTAENPCLAKSFAEISDNRRCARRKRVVRLFSAWRACGIGRAGDDPSNTQPDSAGPDQQRSDEV